MLDVHQRQHTCLNTLCERSYSQDAIMTLLTRILAEHHLISKQPLWLWSCRERRRGPLRGCVELHGRDRAFSATRGVSRGTHSRRPPAPGPTDSAPATTPVPVLWAAPGCCRVLWCWGAHRSQCERIRKCYLSPGTPFRSRPNQGQECAPHRGD